MTPFLISPKGETKKSPSPMGEGWEGGNKKMCKEGKIKQYVKPHAAHKKKIHYKIDTGRPAWNIVADHISFGEQGCFRKRLQQLSRQWNLQR